MSGKHGPRRRTVRRWVNSVLIAVLVGLVGIGVGELVSGRYQMRPVLSGSMRPGLPVGGIVITKRVPIESLRVRDVVVFHRPDQPQELVVHRIISLKNAPSGPVIQTQGDANDARDPWQVSLRGSTAYRASFSVPLVGYAAVWTHGPAGRQTLTIVGGLLILGACGYGLVERRRSAKPGSTSSRVPRRRSTSATRSRSGVELDPRADDIGDSGGDLVGSRLGGSLDHDPHELLGAGRAQQDAAVVAELGLGLSDSVLDSRR
jgi:signal peptidase I